MDSKKTDKQEKAELVNTIQGEVQSIYFKLEDLTEFDDGGIAQQSVIKLMDDLTAIRRNILKKDKES